MTTTAPLGSYGRQGEQPLLMRQLAPGTVVTRLDERPDWRAADGGSYVLVRTVEADPHHPRSLCYIRAEDFNDD